MMLLPYVSMNQADGKQLDVQGLDAQRGTGQNEQFKPNPTLKDLVKLRDGGAIRTALAPLSNDQLHQLEGDALLGMAQCKRQYAGPVPGLRGLKERFGELLAFLSDAPMGVHSFAASNEGGDYDAIDGVRRLVEEERGSRKSRAQEAA